ncbi:TPA: DUF1366 domain-containing protein [Streptococcus suis]|nr:DUF1366 domain-containing protein [Streptococcus suis]
MKFEYHSKSQEFDASGVASATKVVLTNADGAVVPVFLPADHIGLSNTELLEQALEVIYQENFPQRAENERFTTLGEKIDELERTTKEAKAFMENATSEFEAIKGRQDTAEKERNDRFKALEADMQAKIDDAVAELTIMFSGFAGQFEETEVVEETPKDNSPHDVEVEIEE